MYAMSQIPRDIVMSSFQDSITTVSLMNGAKKRALLVNKDLLYRLDGLFAFCHRQWWCHRQMFYRFKRCHGCLNALALIIAAAGIVEGSVLENILLIACLTAAGTVVKGWNVLKKVFVQNRHVPLCLHDLRQNIDRIEYVRGRASNEGV